MNDSSHITSRTIAGVSTSSRSAWYAELRNRPPMLGSADICEVLGIGRTKAWELMHQLGAVKVGSRLKLDRNALIAYVVTSQPDGWGAAK